MISLVFKMAFQNLKMAYAFASHTIFPTLSTAWNTAGVGRSTELRVQMGIWGLSLKLFLSCFSLLISVDTSDFLLWIWGRFFFLFSWNPREPCLADPDMSQGSNSIPIGSLVNGIAVVRQRTMVKHSCNSEVLSPDVCQRLGHSCPHKAIVYAPILYSLPSPILLHSSPPGASWDQYLSLNSSLRVCFR